MRVARKLVLAALLAVVTVFAVHGYFRAKQLSEVFDREGRRDHLLLGRALALGMAHVWVTGGERGALALIDQMNASEAEIDIRFVWIDRASADAAPIAPPDVLAPLSHRHEVTWIQHRTDGSDYLFTYIPVYFNGVHVGAIELRESRAADEALVRNSFRSNAIATALAALATGLAIVAVTISVVGRRARLLAQQSLRIGAGDFDARLPDLGDDEIGDLGHAMNAMAEQLKTAQREVQEQTAARLVTQSQLEHADRVNTVGKLAAGIAHELGTPLNVVAQRAQMIAAREVTDEAATESASVIAEQADRMASIIRQLLDFARRREPRKESADLGRVAKRSVALLRPLAERRKIQIALDEAREPLDAKVDVGQIQQALANLLVNAIQAMPEGGTVTLSVLAVQTEPPAGIEPRRRWGALRVRDEGPGVEAHVLPSVFDPFVTTKSPGEGTGLGLSVAYGLVREHGGWIDVESVAGSGATFTIYLPLESTHAE